ncbi:MAG: mono/diheme cytochrome c family protein [Pirellulaceae bacterium]
MIPALERPTVANSVSPELSGRILIGELNCVACHKTDTAATSFSAKQPPILTNVATRVRPEYIFEFLSNPQAAKHGTTMPDLLGALPEKERIETAEALTQYLATLGAIVELPVEAKRVNNGKKMFHEVGCVACHAPQDGSEFNSASTVQFPDLDKKYTLNGLKNLINDPHKVRPSGRMPNLNLGNQSEDIAHFLLRKSAGDVIAVDLKDLPQISYRYYEGAWSKLPDFETLKPMKSGMGPAFSINVAPKRDNFAMVWEAVFPISRSGRFTFATKSDDGSQLDVDGKQVVDNDGIHGPQEKLGAVVLEPGIHKVTVSFFDASGGEEISVMIAGPGIPRQPLSNLVAANETALAKTKTEEPEPEVAEQQGFAYKPELVEKGRTLFAKVGCASCHEVVENKSPVSSTAPSAKPLGSLTSGGCLAASPPNQLPNYSLSETQRAAITAAMTKVATSPQDAAGRVQQTLLTFNCVACHQYDKLGGIEEVRNPFFLTTQKEMGDEGRVPPPLHGVGAKLTQNYLRDIMNNGAKDRPYMLTKMPKFGGNNVGHIVADLETLAPPLKAPPETSQEFKLIDRRVKGIGRDLVGNSIGKLGCVKCHNFNGIKGTGVQSIDMATMTNRLKPEWFHQYLLNPQAFRPGTRMPAAWPNGQTFLPDVLDGTASQQIESIWRYLSDGSKATAPPGIQSSAIELSAGEQTIMYRNFIEGAGPRAIGVAFPEGANIAFDANEMRLALIWQGKFIDASKHWVGRGPGFQRPLGEQIISFSNGPDLAHLENHDSAWPTVNPRENGYSFLGYRYTEDRRPILRYRINDIIVDDFITGVDSKPFPSLKRTISVSASTDVPLFLRVITSAKIVLQQDGGYRTEDDVVVRILAKSKPIIVTIGGKQELRVPVQGKQTVVQEIVW